jgi:hypothetical protein
MAGGQGGDEAGAAEADQGAAQARPGRLVRRTGGSTERALIRGRLSPNYGGRVDVIRPPAQAIPAPARPSQPPLQPPIPRTNPRPPAPPMPKKGRVGIRHEMIVGPCSSRLTPSDLACNGSPAVCGGGPDGEPQLLQRQHRRLGRRRRYGAMMMVMRRIVHGIKACMSFPLQRQAEARRRRVGRGARGPSGPPWRAGARAGATGEDPGAPPRGRVRERGKRCAAFLITLWSTWSDLWGMCRQGWVWVSRWCSRGCCSSGSCWPGTSSPLGRTTCRVRTSLPLPPPLMHQSVEPASAGYRAWAI